MCSTVQSWGLSPNTRKQISPRSRSFRAGLRYEHIFAFLKGKFNRKGAPEREYVFRFIHFADGQADGGDPIFSLGAPFRGKVSRGESSLNRAKIIGKAFILTTTIGPRVGRIHIPGPLRSYPFCKSQRGMSTSQYLR